MRLEPFISARSSLYSHSYRTDEFRTGYHAMSDPRVTGGMQPDGTKYRRPVDIIA